MNITQMVEILKEDVRNEYKHMLFYLHAAIMLRGMERLYLHDMLVKHAQGEMEHVLEFGHKIRAYGGQPPSGHSASSFPSCLITAREVLEYAVSMEREVVANYHARHAEAAALDEPDISLVVFIEDQIEDSQRDIDELVQILSGSQ